MKVISKTDIHSKLEFSEKTYKNGKRRNILKGLEKSENFNVFNWGAHEKDQLSPSIISQYLKDDYSKIKFSTFGPAMFIEEDGTKTSGLSFHDEADNGYFYSDIEIKSIVDAEILRRSKTGDKDAIKILRQENAFKVRDLTKNSSSRFFNAKFPAEITEMICDKTLNSGV